MRCLQYQVKVTYPRYTITKLKANSLVVIIGTHKMTQLVLQLANVTICD